jgi:hypothetical protein
MHLHMGGFTTYYSHGYSCWRQFQQWKDRMGGGLLGGK